MRPYVAGATALNRAGPGFSRDIDVFNDREGSVGAEADTDVTLLGNDGFEVRIAAARAGPRCRKAQRARARRTAARPLAFVSRNQQRHDLFGPAQGEGATAIGAIKSCVTPVTSMIAPISKAL